MMLNVNVHDDEFACNVGIPVLPQTPHKPTAELTSLAEMYGSLLFTQIEAALSGG